MKKQVLTYVCGLLITVFLGGTVVAQTPVEYRINIGGTDYTDTAGNLYEADKPYVVGDFGYVGGMDGFYGSPIGGTIDDPLYQSVRRGTSFSYIFDNIPVGNYQIQFYFMEPLAYQADQRLFDVIIEDSLALDDFDIYLFSGSPSAKAISNVGTLEAYREAVQMAVSDGQLNIDFNVVAGGNAIVSAIAVVEMPTTPLAAYQDVAAQVGIIFPNETNPGECSPPVGTGSAWADYDNDGDVDLYMTNHGGPNRMYRNEGDTNGDGLPDFVDVAASLSVDQPLAISHAAVFIDYDNDGDQDLYVTNWGANTLFQNQLIETGAVAFLDVTAAAGVADGGRAVSAAWGDFDRDGYLDFYLAKHFQCMSGAKNSEDHLYHNNGDGTFSDVTDWLCPGGTAPCPQTDGLGFAAGWVDYDNDGDLDLYLVNDNITAIYYPNVLWRNDGPDGTGKWLFTDVSASSGAGQSVNGMGLGVADYDNDGFLDLAFSNVSPNKLLHNNGDGTFREVSAFAGIQRSLIREISNKDDRLQWTWGTAFFDHDNDGWQDLFFVAGPLSQERSTLPGAFFHNNGDGTFTERTNSSGLGLYGRGRNASIVDFDGDGFVDMLINHIPDVAPGPYPFDAYPWLFHNSAVDSGNTNNWLTVTVEGTVSNRDGIGTKLWLTTTDGITQLREISSGTTHGGGDYRAAYFGLGANTTGDLTVEWPGGLVENVGTVSANQKLHLIETPPNEPDIRVNLFALDFGKVGVGNSAQRFLKITNQGAQLLTISDLTFTNSLFSAPDAVVPFDIQPYGGDVVLTLQFDPVAVGMENGNLQISSNDPDEALLNVSLTGEGVTSTAIEYHINAGGADFTDLGGTLFVADKAYSAGDFGYVGGVSNQFGGEVGGTTDDLLYQTMRGNKVAPFSYVFDNLPAGQYEITLYFTEPSATVAGQRVFDVLAEGIVVLDNLDIFAVSGGQLIAHTEKITTTVSDGQLTLDFQPVTNTNAIVSAVSVLSVASPPPATFRINAGGLDYTDSNGDLFVADKAYVAGDFGYTEGIVNTFPSPVSGTVDDELYQSMRGNKPVSFSYIFDGIPNGTYDITLYFTEPYSTTVGQRIFDVAVEGMVVLDNFDIFAVSGGKFVAHQEAIQAGISDGQLNIEFTPVTNTHALVSAIAVTPAAGMSAEAIPSEKNASLASAIAREFRVHQNYPNPFNPTTKIGVTLARQSEVSIKIYDVLGRQIRDIFSGIRQAGYYEAVWDGRDQNGQVVSSGVYIYRVKTTDRVVTRKMLFVR